LDTAIEALDCVEALSSRGSDAAVLSLPRATIQHVLRATTSQATQQFDVLAFETTSAPNVIDRERFLASPWNDDHTVGAGAEVLTPHGFAAIAGVGDDGRLYYHATKPAITAFLSKVTDLDVSYANKTIVNAVMPFDGARCSLIKVKDDVGGIATKRKQQIDQNDALEQLSARMDEWTVAADRQLVQYIDNIAVDLKVPAHLVHHSMLDLPKQRAFPALAGKSLSSLRERAAFVLHLNRLILETRPFVERDQLAPADHLLDPLLKCEFLLKSVREWPREPSRDSQPQLA
jgi:hypothetical protein